MQPKFSTLFWGLALIITGGFAFADHTGYLKGFTRSTWIMIFASASALFFIIYLIKGIRAWGWLFPACISAAFSETMFIVDMPFFSDWIPTMIVGSVAIPFIAAFLLDRSRSWAIISAFILGFFALIPQLDHLLNSQVKDAVITGGAGLSSIWGIGLLIIGLGLVIVSLRQESLMH